MRKFKINVNGQSYEVEVEEISSKENTAVITNTVTREEKKIEKPQPKPEVKEEINAQAGQEIVEAPMPGNIWKIVAQEGQQLKAGDVILILEAMKMEIEIVAPRDGKLVKILVNEGNSVNTGDKLAIIE
jgi:biotin carboxyl carrier protein